MKISGYKTITIYSEIELGQLLNKVVEFGKEYQNVEIDKFVCTVDGGFKFSVELRGESEIEYS